MEKESKLNKINFYFSWIIRISLLIAIPLTILEKNWLFVFLSILTLILTFLPIIIERKYKLKIPAEIQIFIILFIYAGIFLGGVRNFYYTIWWWDSLLHFVAGIGLGFIGFLTLYFLKKTGKFKASPGLLVFFTFCFAITMGVLWEIFEFFMDFFLGYNMQKAKNLELIYGYKDTYLGVIDTMFDLILDTLGALIVSITGYFYLIKKEPLLFKKIIKKFEKENKNLLKK